MTVTLVPREEKYQHRRQTTGSQGLGGCHPLGDENKMQALPLPEIPDDGLIAQLP